MAKTQKQKTFRQQVQKPILATALAAAGVFNMVNAVYAEGAPAGENISNTATATYEDGNPDTPTINTTSNTVVVQVAEIAGLTAVVSPVDDVNGGAIENGDQLVYTFEVTNVGNAPTDVFIPELVLENLDLSRVNPDGTVNNDVIEIVTPDGTVVAVADNASLGDLYSALTGDADIAADESFIVRVYGTPTPGTVAGEPVGVTLGDTDDNPTEEGPDGTQNQPTANDDGVTDQNDLRTVNVGTVSPENGEREAEAEAAPTFASSVNPLALATILKTATQNPMDPALVTDDMITYSLELEVESNSPDPINFAPAALIGTELNSLNGNPANRVLVSDAIPEGTVFDSVDTFNLPAGWTPVYTNTIGGDALSAVWTDTLPATGTVTRVGFVYDPVAEGPIAVGETVTGLNFTVVTSDLPASGGIIENIAQVFGTTEGGDPTDPDQIIYDESGDQDPNNFEGAVPPDPSGSDYDPLVDTGIPDELDDDNNDNQPDDTTDVDTGNDNTGTGPDGEINVVSVTPTAVPDDGIFNGTEGDADAVGPTSDNDDFTNLSTTVPVDLLPGDTFDPAAVTFDNSVSNPLATTTLVDVTLEPLSPSEAEFASDPLDPTNRISYPFDDDDIPDGTLVTIEFSGQAAVYEYDEANDTFDLITNDTSNPTVVDPAAVPVNVGDLAPGDEVGYTVTIDLPLGTEQLDSVPVPIVAFTDDDPTASPGYQDETTNNITIDRLYTGFMELTKAANIIDADGNVTPFTGTEATAPGESIEYVLTYENISESLGGSGSVLLTATDFVIVEDGTATIGGAGASPTTTNNWAEFTTHEQATSAESGTTVNYYTLSADTTPAGTVDPASGSQVEKYENVVPSVAPGVSGEFTFRRMVNEGPTP
ncbi:MAG: hypothetical protein AAF716_11870 [Cyanobacteria bacterium P01_D01_bin.1]